MTRLKSWTPSLQERLFFQQTKGKSEKSPESVTPTAPQTPPTQTKSNSVPTDSPTQADPEALRPDYVKSAAQKVAQQAPKGTAQTLRPFESVLNVVSGKQVQASLTDHEEVASVAVGDLDSLGVTEADIDALNDRFLQMDDTEFAGVVGQVAGALRHVEELGEHFVNDPIVPTEKILKDADANTETRAERARQVTDAASKFAARAEGLGHIGLPPMLIGLAKGIEQVAHTEAAHAISHGLHLAVEGIHAAVGVLDTFMFVRHLKHGGSKAELAFHAARGLMSFASLVVPALSIGVVALTVGKIGVDLYRGTQAGKKLDASLDSLVGNLRTMLSEQADAPAPAPASG